MIILCAFDIARSMYFYDDVHWHKFYAQMGMLPLGLKNLFLLNIVAFLLP